MSVIIETLDKTITLSHFVDFVINAKTPLEKQNAEAALEKIKAKRTTDPDWFDYAQEVAKELDEQNNSDSPAALDGQWKRAMEKMDIFVENGTNDPQTDNLLGNAWTAAKLRMEEQDKVNQAYDELLESLNQDMTVSEDSIQLEAPLLNASDHQYMYEEPHTNKSPCSLFLGNMEGLFRNTHLGDFLGLERTKPYKNQKNIL